MLTVISMVDLFPATKLRCLALLWCPIFHSCVTSCSQELMSGLKLLEKVIRHRPGYTVKLW